MSRCPGFEAEVAGEPTAARVKSLDRRASCIKKLRIGVPAQYGVLMAVHLREPVHATKSWWRPARRVIEQQFGQRHALATESLRVEILAQELDGVGAEYGETARLETDDQPAGVEMLGQRRNRRSQSLLGYV